uniref:Cytochrome P450 n=1 Tax=Phanerodontia chrysosporium TaxID=2822231 RepID=G5EJS1_PHACH|nr:cytochrome P450 [Phanerodontia chrysosporium]
MTPSHSFPDLVASCISAWTLCFALGFPIAAASFYSLFGPFNLHHIPTVGGSSIPLISHRGVRKYMRDAKGVLQDGYKLHKGKAFKVALTDRWLVVITGKRLVDELQKMPEDVASFVGAVADFQGFRYIFGQKVLEDPFHVNIIRSHLTKHLSSVFGDICDEIHIAFSELIPQQDEEWVPVHAIQVVRTIVARASNRVFVGLPVCRNAGYLSLAVNFIVDVAKARNFIALFPPVLKPLAAKMTSDIGTRVQEGMQYLEPLINERLRPMEQFGKDWTDNPNDTLQWMMDGIMERDGTIEQLVRIVLLENFSSIHSSSNTFTHALYHLAANPEYITPLREEVETAISEEGWTKAAMSRLRKVDSFLRESLRLNGINPVSMQRKALKSFTLSDGTYIPKGTILVTPALATHHDEDNYEDATTFKPFRFVGEKPEDDVPLVTTSADFVPFGHGRQACPGRFFAAHQMKAMMAYLVLNYDVKFENEGVRPQNVHGVLSVQPDPKARVLFRRRKSSYT